MTDEARMYKRVRRNIGPGKYAVYWMPNTFAQLPDEEVIERCELDVIGTKKQEPKPLPKYEAYADK